MAKKPKFRATLEWFGLSSAFTGLISSGVAAVTTGGALYLFWQWLSVLPSLIQFFLSFGVLLFFLAFIGRGCRYLFESEKPLRLNLTERLGIPRKADQAKAVSEQSATTDSLDVVLRQVSGGGHTGIIRSTPKSWFWLIQHLTIVNQGDVDEIISFELRMPIGKGSTANFSPVVTVPDGIDVPPETRLFGVEHVPAREPLNGALLFELDRGRIPGLEDAETGESPSFPDIILAKIAIVSELSGIEVVFGFMDLQFHRAKPSD